MLASRVLPPPIPRSPPPVVTFFNIPRRYVKSSMQVGASQSAMEDAKHTRNLRRSSRTSDRPNPTSSPGQTREEKLSSPEESSTKLTRKRAASSMEGVNVGSSQSSTPTDSRDGQNAPLNGAGEAGHVCLCQPEPKIPRPRNAFILYRQHHQHSIVARNPGLANPEISKIIGEQWKAESEEQKKVWQDLAVEEKARHQEQYPDYRYQPRRPGKVGSVSSSTSQHTTVDKYRCPRCGGRSIKTPSSPFLSSDPNTPTLPPPNVTENLTPTTRYLPMMNSLSLDSPAQRRRGPSSLSHVHGGPSPQDSTMYSPLTPNSKRPRYNYPPATNGHRVSSAYYHGRRESLPPLSAIRQSPPNSATMPPPRTPRRTSVDLNVLVPQNHDQSRSVEAMVMSVPYPVKIKVLGRITPPLKEPGPTSPAIQVRGAIVAIEGDDTPAVQELAEWLQDFLSKDSEYNPRLGVPPKAPEDDKREVTFEDYLDLVREWHEKSKQMIEYITTPLTDDECPKEAARDKDADPPIKPIVILPTYQLRASDIYSSRIPIQDAYSPTDHWQWMATLWRGTVGPDLTIYISNYDGKEGVGNAKLVELSEDVRCLTVRKEKGGKFETSALRRVGFEVSEWIRGIGGKAGSSTSS